MIFDTDFRVKKCRFAPKSSVFCEQFVNKLPLFVFSIVARHNMQFHFFLILNLAIAIYPHMGTETAEGYLLHQPQQIAIYPLTGTETYLTFENCFIINKLQLTPLTGTETHQRCMLALISYRCNSHPSRGRKSRRSENDLQRLRLQLTPLTGTETIIQ